MFHCLERLQFFRSSLLSRPSRCQIVAFSFLPILVILFIVRNQGATLLSSQRSWVVFISRAGAVWALVPAVRATRLLHKESTFWGKIVLAVPCTPLIACRVHHDRTTWTTHGTARAPRRRDSTVATVTERGHVIDETVSIAVWIIAGTVVFTLDFHFRNWACRLRNWNWS